MTTETPRTDAIEFRHCPPQPEAMSQKHEDAYALCRQLERELGLSKSEVERLKEEARVGNIALDNLRGEVDLWFNRFREAARQLDSLNPQA